MKNQRIFFLFVLFSSLFFFSCADKYAQIYIKNSYPAERIISKIRVYSETGELLQEKSTNITFGTYDYISLLPNTFKVAIKVISTKDGEELTEIKNETPYSLLAGEDLYLNYAGTKLSRTTDYK